MIYKGNYGLPLKTGQFGTEKPKLWPILTNSELKNQNFYQCSPENHLEIKVFDQFDLKTKTIINSDLKNQNYDQFWPEKPKLLPILT